MGKITSIHWFVKQLSDKYISFIGRSVWG